MLSSSQLQAFSQVAKLHSFSKAAKALFITQSALSQRVALLEEELETALIIRDKSRLRLTPAGDELLRYCQMKEHLENEVVSKIIPNGETQVGVIRIAGFSSVMRSIIMPSLKDFMLKNSRLNVEFFTRELSELPRMLSSNEVDLIVTSNAPLRQGIISTELGVEENVLVENKKDQARNEIFLDHDPEDQTTKNFFELNGGFPPKFRRNYFDEVYTLIDGVKLGLGRAILPRHLVENEPLLRIVKKQQPLNIPFYLQYYRQPYYSAVHKKVIEEICATSSRVLS